MAMVSVHSTSDAFSTHDDDPLRMFSAFRFVFLSEALRNDSFHTLTMQ